MKKHTFRLSTPMKRWGKVSLLACLTLGVFISTAQARLIFTTEDEGVIADTYHVDLDGDSPDYVNLAFGSGITAMLQFDIAGDNFEFTKPLSMEGNEIRNFVAEHLSTAQAPTCDGTTQGRIYFDTTKTKLVYCNGTDWQDPTSTLDPSAVTSTEILDGTILADDLAADSVTAEKLNADTAGDGLSQDGTGALQINTDGTTIETSGDSLKIVDQGVDTAQLADGSVTSAKILDGTITSADIGTGAVTSDEILDGTITSADILDNTITADDINTGAVTSDEILDDTITLSDIKARNFAEKINAEYPNFTLQGTGKGTLESDHDNTQNVNYYQWQTKQSTSQSYDIVFQWTVPEGFQAFQNTADSVMLGYRNDGAASQLEVDIQDTSGASLISGFQAAPASGTWSTLNVGNLSSASINAGDVLTFVVRMTSQDSEAVQAGPFTFKYTLK